VNLKNKPKNLLKNKKTEHKSASSTGGVEEKKAKKPKTTKETKTTKTVKEAKKSKAIDSLSPKEKKQVTTAVKEMKKSAPKKVVKKKRVAKNITPSKKLSLSDALTKYKARLYTIPAEQFKCLDNCWISVYDTNIRKKGPFEPGMFPLKWTKVLDKVAKEKGVHIKGVLPHYGRTNGETGLKKFFYSPNIVEKTKEKDYQKAGSVEGLEFSRIYVGRSMAGIEEESVFSFLPSDHTADTFWAAVKEGLEKST